MKIAQSVKQQNNISPRQELSALKTAFALTMLKVIQQVPQAKAVTQQIVKEFESTIPHVIEVTSSLSDFIPSDYLNDVYIGLSRLYYGQGAYHLVTYWREEGVEAIKCRLGLNSLQTATSLDYLASAYRIEGFYADAELL